MSLKRIWLFLLVLCTVACRGVAFEPPTQVLLGDVFTIGQGKTAVIPNENLTITFDNVISDSRCPTQVNCAEEGQAEPVVMIRQGESEPVALEFNTNSSPDLNRQKLPFGDYEVVLQSLDPYPQDPDQPIELSEYRVTLMVTKP